jgi:acyl-CoA thioesterase
MRESTSNGSHASAQEFSMTEFAVQALFNEDRASQALGLHIESVAAGAAQVSMRVRADMLNGHRTCHGGLLFSLADSAFAFACNSYGDTAIAVSASIDFLLPAREADDLTAIARELWRSKRSGIYEVIVTNQYGQQVALFRGRSQRIDGPVIP